MQPQSQEKKKKHHSVHWTRWFLLTLVLIAVIGLAILWISQSAQALVPSIIFVVLGTLATILQLFFQLHSTSSPPSSVSSHQEEILEPSSFPSQGKHNKVTIDLSPENSQQLYLPTPTVKPDGEKVDWGEAPHTKQFYGREKELLELEQWIGDAGHQVVALLGIGGVGKTTLAAQLVERVQGKFDYVFWRSLQNALPLEDLLSKCIPFFSDQQDSNREKELNTSLLLLIECLRKKRCLLVLDNFETILRDGVHTGQYLQGYEDYGKLLLSIGEMKHQSCLLLTSREKPKEITHLEGEASPARLLSLIGLEEVEGRKILESKGLIGSNEECANLVRLYSGNPLALKLVSEPVRELFGGSISTFLQEQEIVSVGLHDLLNQQWKRLSILEREILFWLAIERETTSIDQLREDMTSLTTNADLLQALASLRRRSLIETAGAGRFILQPVIMEYVTKILTLQIYEEIVTETIGSLGQYALVKAQAKAHVRESQIRLILMPLGQRLLASLGPNKLEQHCKHLLSLLRETQPQHAEYAAGNILNLLAQLQFDLRGYDFSSLTLWQACLHGIVLHDANFAHADIQKSTFTDTFGNFLFLSFSSDGNLLAAGTNNSSIRVWKRDGTSITPLLNLSGHTDWVRSVSFHPGGELLASGSNDHTIRIWNVKEKRCLHVLEGHTGWVRVVIFHPDGHILASAGNDHTIRLWDVQEGRCLDVIDAQAGQVRALTCNPDGTLLAIGCADFSVRLWDIKARAFVSIFQGHQEGVWSVAFDKNGQVLASGSDDGTIRLWDVNTNKHIKTLQGPLRRVRTVAFHPNLPLLISGSEDQTVRLWDTSTGHCLNTFYGHTSWVRAIACTPDGTIIASGSDDQTIRLWDINTGNCLSISRGYNTWIKSIAWSPDGKFLASNDGHSIRLWDSNTGEHLKTLDGHNSWLRAVTFSPDSKFLASCSEDKTIRLWDPISGQCLNVLHGHSSWVTSVAFSPDGKFLASCSEIDDTTTRLWDVSTGQCLYIWHGHISRISSVAFNVDGNFLASGSDDWSIRLYNVSTGEYLKTFRGHEYVIRSIAFSPDGSILASASGDHTVRLWAVGTAQCLHVLQGHSGWVRSVAFSTAGMIASGSDDHTVRLWEASTGHHLMTLHGHTDHVRTVAFEPGGQYLASGSRDGTIKLWNIQTGECLKTLKYDRPYERMDITGTKGLNEAQKATIKALGAVEN